MTQLDKFFRRVQAWGVTEPVKATFDIPCVDREQALELMLALHDLELYGQVVESKHPTTGWSVRISNLVLEVG